MGYRLIPSNAFAVGKVTSQLLWRMVRSNFISHEERISELEDNANVLLPGLILSYGGSSAPTGFLMCDGSAVSQTDYADLYAIIGISYGNPGGGLFNLPDLRGRTLIGKGTGIGLSSRLIGATGGEEEHEITLSELPSHGHTINDPTHRHAGVYALGPGALPYHHFSAFSGETTPVRTTDATSTGITIGNTGGGGAHNNMQPSLVVNFIIKT